MLLVESVCTPCCMFCVSLSVACCQELLRKVWNRSSFPTTPNISFVPWSPKSSVTMLDLFAQLFQHCLGHADALHVVSFKFTKPYRPRLVLPTMHCRSQHCLELLHPSAITDFTDATMLAQQRWELLRPSRSFTSRHPDETFFLDPWLPHVWSSSFSLIFQKALNGGTSITLNTSIFGSVTWNCCI